MLISRLALRGSIASAALIASALAVPAIAQESRTHLSIPAQDLPSSLRALAQATGQQISFDSATIGRKQAPALDGTYTVREAVARGSERRRVGKGGVSKVNSRGSPQH